MIQRPWLNPSKGRKLTDEDLERMRLPKRCWDTTVSKFQASDASMKQLKRYAATMRQQRRNGVGFMLLGNNGVGKTCIAAHYAKVFRSHGQSVMFVRAGELIESSQRKVLVMAGDYDMWEFAKLCDVLVIDDLGKEHRPSSGYSAGLAERKLEDLLRARYDRRGVTLITTNMTSKALVETYKQSTMSIMQSMMIKLKIQGEDLRSSSMKEDTKAVDNALQGTGFLQI